MRLQDVKRGEQVFVVTHGPRARDGVVSAEYRTVTSAGPKFVTAGEGWKSTKFHRNGAEVTDCSPHSFAFRSEGEWRAYEARQALNREAERLAREFKADKLTEWQLTELIELLEAAK